MPVYIDFYGAFKVQDYWCILNGLSEVLTCQLRIWDLRSEITQNARAEMQGNVVKMNFIAVGKFCLVKGVVKSKCHRLEGGIYDVQSNKKKKPSHSCANE